MLIIKSLSKLLNCWNYKLVSMSFTILCLPNWLRVSQIFGAKCLLDTHSQSHLAALNVFCVIIYITISFWQFRLQILVLIILYCSILLHSSPQERDAQQRYRKECNALSTPHVHIQGTYSWKL
jgi:hypothetical protein